jgi:hypothetical protein
MFIPKRCSPVGFTNKLAEKLNAMSKMCEVIAVSSQVMGYVEPLQSVNEVMVRSHEYKKESASSAVTLRLTSSSSQKPFATADSTSDEESAAVNSNKRNTPKQNSIESERLLRMKMKSSLQRKLT